MPPGSILLKVIYTYPVCRQGIITFKTASAAKGWVKTGDFKEFIFSRHSFSDGAFRHQNTINYKIAKKIKFRDRKIGDRSISPQVVAFDRSYRSPAGRIQLVQFLE